MLDNNILSFLCYLSCCEQININFANENSRDISRPYMLQIVLGPMRFQKKLGFFKASYNSHHLISVKNVVSNTQTNLIL